VRVNVRAPLDPFRRQSKQGVRRNLGWSDALRKGTSKEFFPELSYDKPIKDFLNSAWGQLSAPAQPVHCVF